MCLMQTALTTKFWACIAQSITAVLMQAITLQTGPAFYRVHSFGCHILELKYGKDLQLSYLEMWPQSEFRF